MKDIELDMVFPDANDDDGGGHDTDPNELEMWETRLVKSPDYVDTGALAPCIGLIIYNVKMKAAVAAHVVDAAELKPAIAMAALEIAPLEDQKVYVGGALAEITATDEERDYIMDMRRKTLDMLSMAGYKPHQITARFNDAHDSASIRLYTDSGEVEWYYMNYIM